MTQEQKAKAYDEAIEKAKEYFNSPRTCFDIEQLCNIFPELTESEDERIRKRIIHALHGDVLEMSEIKEAVAWLEKQVEQKYQYISRPKYIGEEELLGEQKPTEWSKEDERIKNNLLSELTNLSVRKLIEKETEKKYASWLKSLRPQSHWRPSKEQLHILESVIADYDNQGLSFTKDMLCDLYEDLKKLKG